jgi:hypothetical protein
MADSFKTFREFYAFYLSEHRHPICRRLHFAGSVVAIAAIVVTIATHNAWWLVAVPAAGYGFAWIGHFFFEKNRPATFSHPFYSLLGDWVMFRDVLTGRIPF